MKKNHNLPLFIYYLLPDDFPTGKLVKVKCEDEKERILIKAGEFKGKVAEKKNPRKSVWYSIEVLQTDEKKHGHSIKDFLGLTKTIVENEKLEWKRDPKKPSGFHTWVSSTDYKQFLQEKLHKKNGWIKITLGGFDEKDGYIFVVHISYRRKKR